MSSDVSVKAARQSCSLSEATCAGAMLLQPPPKRTAGEWARMNRKLPRGSAEPGPFNPDRTPYLNPIYEAAMDAQHRRVVICMASQSGKSECILNLIGHALDDDPRPILAVFANQRQAESIGASRLTPMIENCPSLAAKLDRRESKNKITEKFVSGVRVGLAWAGSPTELSSHPCALVLLDELDRFPSETGTEGDPLTLAEARVAPFGDAKVIIASSPTLEGGSRIWGLWENGTAAKWTWPCPQCGGFFAPCFDFLKWPEKATPAQAKRMAWLECPHCQAHLTERHKPAMNERGQYELTGDPDSDCASFWVSGLCSPWRTWGQLAASWIEAARSHEPAQCQSVLNTRFGELFRVSGEAPPVSKVAQLRGAYHFDEVPSAARVLTGGVDVQGDRLVYAIRAWGAASTSWLIRHGELWGDTQPGDPVWHDLAELLEVQYGTLGRVRLTLIDSGFRPDAVYAFARRAPGVLPAKGADGQAKPVYLSRLDVNVRGEPQRRGVRLAHIDSSYFKTWVHSRINWPLDQPGAWHLPAEATDDYCEQLVAEERVVKANGAVKWLRTKKANHFLDCEALCAAAAHLLQIHTLRAKPAPDAVDPGDPSAPQQSQQPHPPPAPPRTRPNPRFAKGGGWSGSSSRPFMTSWRR
jgi:phage terminase large subunit GpA-like protein